VDAHVVPRVYLNGFAKTSGTPKGVAVYDIRRPYESQILAQNIQNTRDVSTKPDFYIARRQSGQDASLEEAFSQIEDGWTGVRAALKGGNAFEGGFRNRLLSFAAAQEARVSRNRLMLARPLQELLRIAEIEGRARELSEEQIRVWKEATISRHNQGIHVEGAQDLESLSLLALPAFVRTNLIFFALMRPALLTSTEGDFLTSDHPVLWFDPYAREANPCPSKWSLTAEVTFPLTRRHCLLLSYTPLVRSREVGRDVVQIVNARTRCYAFSEIYAYPALTQDDRERHREYLLGQCDPVSLAQTFSDSTGPVCNIRLLLKLLDAGTELFISGNRHVAPAEDLLALVS
jgi:hypothetical protein